MEYVKIYWILVVTIKSINKYPVLSRFPGSLQHAYLIPLSTESLYPRSHPKFF